jgi:hypothetical protein
VGIPRGKHGGDVCERCTVSLGGTARGISTLLRKCNMTATDVTLFVGSIHGSYGAGRASVALQG